MNVKEGTRRLAVLIGVIGCAVGCYASYGAARNLWMVRQFESLMALPVTREIEQLAKEFQASTRPRVSTIDLETLKKQPQGHKDEFDLSAMELGGVVRPSPDFKPKSLPKTLPPDFFDVRTPESSEFVSGRDSAKAQGRGLLTVVANRDGIQSVTADSNGDIQSFSLITGETVSRPKARLLMSQLLVALYPVLGFALPWGTLRALAWVIAGFTAPPASVSTK